MLPARRAGCAIGNSTIEGAETRCYAASAALGGFDSTGGDNNGFCVLDDRGHGLEGGSARELRRPAAPAKSARPEVPSLFSEEIACFG